MNGTDRSGSAGTADLSAGEWYLLLADISGYTGFMAGVETEHGVDFSEGIPAAYGVLGDLLDSVVEGLAPDLTLVKLEGDAVFAMAPANALDGDCARVVAKLNAMYGSFLEHRTAAIPANDHVCIACPAVAHLDLKVVLHRGHAVRQRMGSSSDLLGPAVTVTHRLLKNTVRATTGLEHYLFMTEAAAAGLGPPDAGVEHQEAYDDIGAVQGHVLELVAPVRDGA